jgi:predicted nucleic acid-binding protein
LGFAPLCGVLFINEAARLKSRNKMSHADSLGLAVAKELGAAFVTSDHSVIDK